MVLTQHLLLELCASAVLHVARVLHASLPAAMHILAQTITDSWHDYLNSGLLGTVLLLATSYRITPGKQRTLHCP